jgi:hypothetical protein
VLAAVTLLAWLAKRIIEFNLVSQWMVLGVAVLGCACTIAVYFSESNRTVSGGNGEQST